MKVRMNKLGTLALGAAALLLIGQGCLPQPAAPPAQNESAAPATAPETQAEVSPKKEEKIAEKTAPVAVTKSFTVTAKQWSFDPATITVKKGDKVKLTVKSVDVSHGFSLSAFGVNQTLEPNKEVAVEFVADKTGSFPFVCSVFCGSGHGGMKGTLIVE